MTTAAWLMVIGCGVCLLVTLGMVAVLLKYRSELRCLRRDNRGYRDENSALDDEILNLQRTVKNLKNQLQTATYTIREEEYV